MDTTKEILSDVANNMIAVDGLSTWATSRGVTDAMILKHLDSAFMRGNESDVAEVNAIVAREYARSPELFTGLNSEGLFDSCCLSVADRIFQHLAEKYFDINL